MRNCHNGGECRFTWQDSAVFRGVSYGRILPGCLGSGMSQGSSKDRGLSVALALRMPRPCAVELRVRGYKERLAKGVADATALRRGGSRSPLRKPQATKNVSQGDCGCHGLAPWRFTFAAKKTSGYKERLAGDCGCHGLAPWRFEFAATKKVSRGIADATALRRGGSRSPLQRKSRGGLRMPRPCAVEVHVRR